MNADKVRQDLGMRNQVNHHVDPSPQATTKEGEDKIIIDYMEFSFELEAICGVILILPT